MKAFQPSCSGSKQRIFAAVELDFGAGNPNHGDNNLVSVLFSRLLHPRPPYQLFGGHGRFFFARRPKMCLLQCYNGTEPLLSLFFFVLHNLSPSLHAGSMCYVFGVQFIVSNWGAFNTLLVFSYVLIKINYLMPLSSIFLNIVWEWISNIFLLKCALRLKNLCFRLEARALGSSTLFCASSFFDQRRVG